MTGPAVFRGKFKRGNAVAAKRFNDETARFNAYSALRVVNLLANIMSSDGSMRMNSNS
jgi:hypothetical protein